MRLATITNWAYGATVVLTLASATTMILANDAHEAERLAIAQRYRLDQATARVGEEVYALTGHARRHVITGDPADLIAWRRDRRLLGSIEERLHKVRDIGAGPQELDALKQALRWADSLLDEQAAALASAAAGNRADAQALLFGSEYERELDRAEAQVERFQDRLDQRTDTEVAAATDLARIWRTVSQAVLAATGLLVLFVLGFIIRERVLRPVVRLSDVVTRLAAQDYAAEPPEVGRIDEIGDMAQALRVFRENGLERQRLEEERARDRQQRDLLARMTQRMQGCDTLAGLREVVLRFLPELAPGMAGRLYLLDGARNAVVELCDWAGPRASRAEFPPVACWALRRGAPHRPAGRTIDVPCDHLDWPGEVAIDSLCLPLIAQRETLGLLYLEPCADAGLATPDVVLQMLAENIGLALANLRLRDALRTMAMTDPLTGLANRRQLDEMVAREIAEAEQDCRPVSCLMMDVDHFKRFNDQFGHDAGDIVLREVGAVLRNLTRADDLAFRYGGEEFLLLLPGAGTDVAAARAETIREAVAALALTHEGRPLGAVALSVGVATAPFHVPGNRLVQAADAALLRAKELGRDRTVVADKVERRSAA